MPATARVALPLPVPETFSYRIPPDLTGAIRPGLRVVVPFGRRRLPGVVVELEAPGPALRPLKTILSLLDPAVSLTPDLLEFTRRLSDYYFAPWGLILQAALPTALSTRAVRRIEIAPAGRELLENPFSGIRGPERRALDLLARRGPLREETIRKRLAIPRSRVPADLVARGWARIAGERLAVEPGRGGRRAAGAGASPPGSTPGAAPAPVVRLNPAQQAAGEALGASLARGGFRIHLLEGVTGSGKTEVYLFAATRTLDRGKGVIYLVPEIGLTPLLERRVEARFPGRVATLHSGLPETVRRDAWRRIREGDARFVLGTRSAVFAPVSELGLVIVDEEQDPSYAQTETPRYNARDAALARARHAGATAILGSATPSLESVLAARAGRSVHLNLPARFEDRPMPEVLLVDMREEFRATGSQAVLSRALVAELRRVGEAGEQALLLLNRRGFATFLLCRACGETVRCPRCGQALTQHRTDGTLRCHLCPYRRRTPTSCPACRSPHLHPGGAGTQRLEEAVRVAHPGARLARMDRDTVGRGGHADLLTRFARGEIDVLVGTQMLAKGHDFPQVTLVGVVSADAYLGLPDFRAAERTYQLLAQVAGRAGRGDRPGRVLVQAYAPEHYVLQAVQHHDPGRFYERELRLRKLMRLPPHISLIQLRVEDRDPARGASAAARVAERVRRAAAGEGEVLGPSPAPLPRIAGRHRFQILLRGERRGRLGDAVREAIRSLRKEGSLPRNLVVEPDPVSVL
jgi:primosomal protein N' (replication factor Y)